MSAVWIGVGLPCLLAIGLYVVALLDAWSWNLATGNKRPMSLGLPFQYAARLLIQQRSRTERPDQAAWKLAPAMYLALAVLGLSIVPWSQSQVAADVEAGIVLWGAVESATVVAVFLHGWSANSVFPLLGGYRYVATGLSAMLVSMFVLIAVALPAESLNVGEIVESQRTLWNVVRQPLGLPLFLILGLSVSLRGPFDYADSEDLAGGTTSEVSGSAHLAWRVARHSMLLAFATIAASCFLGGYLGPWLPGPIWLALKTLLLLGILVSVSHLVARVSASRMLTLLWLVFLPLSFLSLAAAGLLALP